MKSEQIRQKFLDFFKSKDHVIIPSAPLVPENDPTVLFTTAGMHPLVPFLLGQTHAAGKRLANFQKCIRTGDIDEVGDSTHLTYFEMLGNWSLGDYFKPESIQWSWEFLTSKEWIGLSPDRIAITCFGGDKRHPDLPVDKEAAQIWQNLGVKPDRIAFLEGGVEESKLNWWGPAGQTGPCGPDTEIFYWVPDDIPAPDKFDPDDEGWVEIWNNVFMQYNKNESSQFEQLEQKNVDTGLGFARLVMVLQSVDNVYDTDLFEPIMTVIDQRTNIDDIKAKRIIADHLRTAVFLLAEKVVPSNVDQGYVLRRIIRRTVRFMRLLEVADETKLLNEVIEAVIKKYSPVFPELAENQDFIELELTQEHEKFNIAVSKGIKEFEKYLKDIKDNNPPEKQILSGRLAFKLYDTYGFPIEMTTELAEEVGIKVDREGFDKAFAKHQELSREASAGKFKGGLADNSEITTAYHSLTHILHAALRDVLGNHVEQRGSNITADRLRFDFSHPDKLTDTEKKQIEDWVNHAISNQFAVKQEEMSIEDALATGAIGLFKDKYGGNVTVYTMYNPETDEIYSREICGGPHIETAQDLGKFKIKKEESSSAGIRRIKAVLEK